MGQTGFGDFKSKATDKTKYNMLQRGGTQMSFTGTTVRLPDANSLLSVTDDYHMNPSPLISSNQMPGIAKLQTNTSKASIRADLALLVSQTRHSKDSEVANKAFEELKQKASHRDGNLDQAVKFTTERAPDERKREQVSVKANHQQRIKNEQE